MISRARTLAASAAALSGALALVLASDDAGALVLARVTRHGYILVDEPGANNVYEGHAAVDDNSGLFGTMVDITTAIDTAGLPHARFVAMMQTTYEPMQFAFYFGLVNEVMGIGEVSPLGGGRETYDLNMSVGTPYPITGFVFLNELGIYTDPMGSAFGRYVICTQEFGHNALALLRVPQLPAWVTNDAGPPDDAAADPGPPIVAQEPQALLGRQRAHWSYFMNSGGSPMEGNLWEEIEPGTFRTGTPSFRFSPLDMYVMGLIPPTDVPPFYLIVNPDALGQTDQNGQAIFRESPPEYGGRTISIRGQRLTYTIDDIVHANGPRVPSYDTADAGPDADPSVPRVQPDLDVSWVLLAAQDEVSDALADQFDQAIESCTMGYDGASDNRSRLIAVVPPSDAGDGSADGSLEAGADDASARDVPVSPLGDAGADAFVPPDLHAMGGCGACRAAPVRGSSHGALATLVGLGLALVVRRRRG